MEGMIWLFFTERDGISEKCDEIHKIPEKNVIKCTFFQQLT
jgi:hypothetical protein